MTWLRMVSLGPSLGASVRASASWRPKAMRCEEPSEGPSEGPSEESVAAAWSSGESWLWKRRPEGAGRAEAEAEVEAEVDEEVGARADRDVGADALPVLREEKMEARGAGESWPGSARPSSEDGKPPGGRAPLLRAARRELVPEPGADAGAGAGVLVVDDRKPEGPRSPPRLERRRIEAEAGAGTAGAVLGVGAATAAGP
jgi:hypothetical protein